MLSPFPFFGVLCLLLLTACLPSNNSDNTVTATNQAQINATTQDFDFCPTADSLLAGICVSDFYSADGAKTDNSQRLAQCTIIETFSQICPTSTLAFIGKNAGIEKVMSRVIVSDPWMADNFRLLLNAMPADIFSLFASTTAIIIHRNIRPAFFLPATGAIYLDPQYLWITDEERNSIHQAADYRSAFGNSIKFVSLGRYVKQGRYAFLDENGTRGTTQALYALSALLFHELAHAADNFPADIVDGFSASTDPFELSKTIIATSELLNTRFPLASNEMVEVAKVLFNGEQITSFVASLTAAKVGAYFDADIATDDYAYSSTFEDTAMIFEESMMKAHYNIDREIAYATPLNNATNSCNDYSFDYSSVNRINGIGDRVSLVVNQLLPDSNYDSFLSQLTLSRKATYSWCPLSNTEALNNSVMTQKAFKPYKDNVILHDFWH